jgi:DNA replication and repair protein RecF
VEPGAGLALGNASRLAQQRNAWLRSGGRGYRVWDGGYAEAYAALAEQRCRFVGAVNAIFVELTASLLPGGPLFLGWEGSLSESEAMSALSRQWPTDRSRGFTQLSPWRGDLVITQGDRRWCGSRGENKLAAMLLQLAVHRLAADTCPSAVVLVDDPYGEVSPALVLPVLREWVSQADQVFVAALSEPPAELTANKVFHVEHGRTSVLA